MSSVPSGCCTLMGVRFAGMASAEAMQNTPRRVVKIFFIKGSCRINLESFELKTHKHPSYPKVDSCFGRQKYNFIFILRTPSSDNLYSRCVRPSLRNRFTENKKAAVFYPQKDSERPTLHIGKVGRSCLSNPKRGKTHKFHRSERRASAGRRR